MTLLLIGLSGAALSFEQEITRLLNPHIFRPAPKEGERLTYEEILRAVQQQYPGGRIAAIGIPSKNEFLSVTIQLPNAQGRHRRKGMSVYVDPYSGEIVSSLVGRGFFSTMTRLHRWLLLDRETGNQVVAISTVALIILCLSGVILYYPSLRKNFWAALSVSRKLKKRALLYKLHSAAGIWLLIPLLFLSLTGLYWSYPWYREMLYSVMKVELPARFKAQPARPSQQPQRQGGQMSATLEPAFPPQNVAALAEDLDVVLEVSLEAIPDGYSSLVVAFPMKGQVYNLFYLDKNARHNREQNELKINANNHAILAHARYEDRGLNEQMMDSMRQVHSGEFFGLFGRILFFVSSLCMPLFILTGWLLYLNRRNKKREKLNKKEANGVALS